MKDSLFCFKLGLFSCMLYFTFLILSVYDFSNISYKPANVMSCHGLNEQNKANDDEVDDYNEESGEPDYVAEEFRQLENQHKPNLEDEFRRFEMCQRG